MNLYQCLTNYKIVIEQKSFSKAALIIDINISALSKQIKWLENYFGERLLNRTTRDQHLTASGEKVYQLANRWLKDITELKDELMTSKLEPKGQLRLSIPSSLGRAFFLDCINQFLKKYPRIDIYIESENSPYLLFDQRADLTISSINIKHEKLIQYHMVNLTKGVFASHKYINDYGKPKSPSELVNFQCLVNSRVNKDLQWKFMTKGNKVESFRLNPRMISSTGVDLVEAAIFGMGLCCVTHIVAKSYIEEGLLLEIDLGQAVEPADIYLYHLPSYANSLTRIFADFIIKYFQSKNKILKNKL
ncbi:LysR family transcriptional regulator [Thiotrichales bacterium 19S3-7]|nr:LysR family transcriptional regulator [Thiotrichales bacterium 19S3-7]MCF6801342.1 LysR family transcriptional regulator [Thiotrichales bacterium 19S3-11]